MQYLKDRRSGWAARCQRVQLRRLRLKPPPLRDFDVQLKGTGDREASTTMAMVRIITQLIKDKTLGKHIVPIVPDEARTFGMEGMFRQVGIYSHVGQLYTPQDADQLMYYREDKKGQILQEGINEAGATCSWIAAGTSYANHGISAIPFYLFTPCSAFSVWAISCGLLLTCRLVGFT